MATSPSAVDIRGARGGSERSSRGSIGYAGAVRDTALVAGVLLASLGYAVVRYNVFAGVSHEHVSVFVANKAISVGALVLIGISGLVAGPARRKALGLVGLVLAVTHVLLSLLVLDRAYLPAQYLPDGTLRALAEGSMLAGAIATALLLWRGGASGMRVQAPRHGRSLLPGVGRTALALVALHTLALGGRGWLEPGAWPGGMPPITLLTFGMALLFCVAPRRQSTRAARSPARVVASGP